MKYFQHKKALVGKKAKIGEKTLIWAFTNIQDGAVIGRGCKICDGCFVESGVIIGNFVTLKNGVAVFKGITLEDDVFCGANCTFINDRHPRSHHKDWLLEKTLVRKGAAIGTNATLLCGITIGEYAVVGAGSVVTKDVAPYTIVIGNPARVKGYACQCGRTLGENLQCSCGLNYRLTPRGILLDA
ncbi:MAG TPA: acyltransferase [Candidatus Omnitrophota bacterium]|nr:acyltransferase [Candidatus Omnitrophota bacterium]